MGIMALSSDGICRCHPRNHVGLSPHQRSFSVFGEWLNPADGEKWPAAQVKRLLRPSSIAEPH